MNKFRAFILESVEEMQTKVTWPTRQELSKHTVLVLVASLIFALVIGGADAGFKYLLKDVIYDVNSAR